MHTRRTRVPSVHGTMICCQWVKLFNPAGINHSRHVRNLCTGAAPECATLRGRTRNIRARPPGRPRRSLPPVTTNSLRYVTLGWPIAKKTRAISPPVRVVANSIPAIYGNRRDRIFPHFCFFFVFLLFFFYGWSINFRPDVTVCINDYNQQVFFSSFQPARGGGSY